jgi:glucose-1-phosphate cytidylyltransferase
VIDSVILCGGTGTRLYPETRLAPKALVQVGRRPVLDWVLDHLVRHGSRRVVLCAGFRANDIRDHALALSITRPVEDGADLVYRVTGAGGESVELLVADTGLDTLTGARVHRVERHLRGDALVTYCDVLTDVSIPDLLSAHRASRAAASLTVTRVRSPFGHLDVSPGGRVRAFDEKPLLGSPVNIGYLVLGASARSRLSVASGQLEEDLLPTLAAEGELSAYQHEGRFEPMDTVADRQRLETMWRGGELDWLHDTIASPTP